VAVPKRACKPKDNSEGLRKVILGQLRKIFRERYVRNKYQFTNDEAGRDDLIVMLHYLALHPTYPREQMRNAIEIWAPWMSKDEAEMIISDLANLARRYLWLGREELRQKVWIKQADRERLGAKNIPPYDLTYDLTDAQLGRHNRAKKLERKRLKRRKAGAKPRSIYLMISNSKLQPWKDLGISRRTWYRRGYHLAQVRDFNSQSLKATTKRNKSGTTPGLTMNTNIVRPGPVSPLELAQLTGREGT
jgi:hypothetical protein